ncbi:hypothetical protein BDV06DRAFT_225901 [Aspergillus oleicola]
MLEVRLHIDPAQTQSLTTRLLTIYGVVTLITAPFIARSTLSNPTRTISTPSRTSSASQTFPVEDYPAKDMGKFLWTQEEGVDVDSDKYKEMVTQELYFGDEGDILGTMEK